MSKGNTAAPAAPTLSDWIDPFEQALRTGVQQFVQELLEAEVDRALGRLRPTRAAWERRAIATDTGSARSSALWDA